MNRDVLQTLAVIFVSLFLGSILFGGMFMDRLADKVIERMEKPYSPSPYGPGLDPDKLDGYRTTIEDLSGEPVKFDGLEWTERWEMSRRDVN